MSSRLLLAVSASAVVILSAPFIREIRDWIKTTFPGQYVTIVAVTVALLVVAALAVALSRIRDRRAARYGALAAAFTLDVGYSLWNAQGNLEVDAVERFHFVEYGLVTFLFYRAFRPFGDLSMLVLPVLAGLVVGVCEEWVQWFVPGRIGDLRDIFLNGAAILSGLLFSLGIDPPDGALRSLPAATTRRIAVAAAVTVVAFGFFIHTVHLGTEIDDPHAGTFRSRYDASALLRLADARSREWKAAPPLARPKSLSREDQYMSEGHLHVQERNRQWAAGNFQSAWLENVILEKYYAPVLETPSFLSRTGHEWNAEQRADGRVRFEAAGGSAAHYVSLADATEGRHFIRTWRPLALWSFVALLVCALLAVATLKRDAPR
jgi:hypothetical protein